MAKPIDTFWLDFTLQHERCDPQDITTALGIKPSFSARKGDVLGTVTRKSSVWMCHFREGIGSEAFARSLDELLALFETSGQYIERFRQSGGELELSMNQVVSMQEGLLFNLHLEPYFLKACGDRGIALRVQAWSAQDVASLK